MVNEDLIVRLIKEAAYESTEEELQEIVAEDFTESTFDKTAEGLALNFSGLDQGKEEEFFKTTFNHYSTNTIYKTEQGYYLVTQL